MMQSDLRQVFTISDAAAVEQLQGMQFTPSFIKAAQEALKWARRALDFFPCFVGRFIFVPILENFVFPSDITYLSGIQTQMS